MSIDACGGHSQRFFLTWRNDWHWMIYLRPGQQSSVFWKKKKLNTFTNLSLIKSSMSNIFYIRFGNTHSLPLLYMGLIVLKCVLIHDTVHKKITWVSKSFRTTQTCNWVFWCHWISDIKRKPFTKPSTHLYHEQVPRHNRAKGKLIYVACR